MAPYSELFAFALGLAGVLLLEWIRRRRERRRRVLKHLQMIIGGARD